MGNVGIRAELLRCPRCAGLLSWGDTQATCQKCRLRFGVHNGPLPILDLFIDPAAKELGRDPSKVWAKDGFERVYAHTGYHEAGSGFDRQLGYPEEISRFYFQRVKGKLLKWVEPGPDHRILDIGCGAGYFLCLLRDEYLKAGFEPVVVGLDASENQLSYMVQRMAKEEIDAIAVHGNGEYLPFSDESFDLVTCSEVIEHVRNPERALAAMNRILKPRGLLLLSTPSITAQRTWGAMLAPFAFVVKKLSGHRQGASALDGYEIPWRARDFRGTIQRSGVQIRDFEYAVIAPHFWHFKFLPRPLLKPVIAGCALLDKFRFVLKPLAQHFLVRATKGQVLASSAQRSAAPLRVTPTG